MILIAKMFPTKRPI